MLQMLSVRITSSPFPVTSKFDVVIPTIALRIEAALSDSLRWLMFESGLVRSASRNLLAINS